MEEQTNQNPTENKPSNEYSKGYGKRPVWFWVVVYVVIAIVLYGAIYLVYKSHNSSSTGSTNTTSTY